ncbi:MAG: hypothetical protein H6733_10250 [Alphaproteobacteria bacterium]|nr:hypothetical protein [Alphaproteobacteria bacterium]
MTARGGIGIGVLALALAGVSYTVGVSAGRSRTTAEKDAEFEGVLEQLASDHKEIEVTKNNQVASLQAALSAKDVEIGTLAALVTKLKDRPAEVRYLTRVETVLGASPMVTVPVDVLPDEHLFVAGPLTVARFASQGGEATFETYDQRFVLDAALGDTSSAFLLRGATSFDDQLHEIPVEVTTTRITPDPPKLLKVHLALGATVFGGAVGQAPRVGVGASLTLPWMHPTPRVDVLTPRATVGAVASLDGVAGFTFRGGLDVVSYNLGREGSIVSDLWLGVGPSYGTDGSWSVDVGLTTRL